jgi:hypothetical protein
VARGTRESNPAIFAEAIRPRLTGLAAHCSSDCASQQFGSRLINSDVPKVLAVASAGGHWEQLMQLRPVLGTYDVRFVTTRRDVGEHGSIDAPLTLPDCNKQTPIRAMLCALAALWLVLRERPDVIVTTGAAPGFFCLMAGRLVGARTLRIDSVANGEQLSLSGRLAQSIADECWTQWAHLATDHRPRFHGAVL